MLENSRSLSPLVQILAWFEYLLPGHSSFQHWLLVKDMANDVYLEQKRSLGNWASSVSYLIIPFSCINCIIKLCHFLIIMSPQVYMFLLLLNDGRHDDNRQCWWFCDFGLAVWWMVTDRGEVQIGSFWFLFQPASCPFFLHWQDFWLNISRHKKRVNHKIAFQQNRENSNKTDFAPKQRKLYFSCIWHN